MKLILEEDINYKTRINDFGVEPINKRIITTGEKLIYFNKGKFEKESGGKVKNCEIPLNIFLESVNISRIDKHFFEIDGRNFEIHKHFFKLKNI